jgi:hypothetical protein
MAKEVQVVSTMSGVMVAFTAVWECPDCAGEREFVQPGCEDGHGSDCPEWACLECGAAILIGPFPVQELHARRELRGAA